MREKIKVSSLLELIDDQVLSSIALATNVDYKVKKLSGSVVFKLLLMSLLDNTKISLRILEKTFSTSLFKHFSGVNKDQSIRYNSLSERLSVINPIYFEKLYHHLYQVSKQYIATDSSPYYIGQFDSTSVSVSSKLLKHSMVNGLKNKDGEHRKSQLKFTVGLLHDLPGTIDFYNQQKYLAEDLTLRESILKAGVENNEVVVFDRGLKKRTTFKEFNDQGLFFVTRINPTKSIKVVEENRLKTSVETQTLYLLSDEQVHLYHQKKLLFRQPFRLIKSRSKQTEEALFFITNINDLKAEEITRIYKKRWEIAVFFKFIKQHLHFKHLLNHSENGIKVMMYMTMIMAILILMYKKINQIKSYKLAKYDFTEELNMEIIKEIVLICGGDPTKSELFDTS